MFQRILHQSTICQASAASLTSSVVSSRQCTASVPVGGGVLDHFDERQRYGFRQIALARVAGARQFNPPRKRGRSVSSARRASRFPCRAGSATKRVAMKAKRFAAA
jgi:hypothetical protein